LWNCFANLKQIASKTVEMHCKNSAVILKLENYTPVAERRYGQIAFILSGLGSNIGRGIFVGWVEHPDIFCWVSFLYPTYLPTIFMLSAKPNKMAEDRIIPYFPFIVCRLSPGKSIS
jgi:hypothetical protein